MAALPDGMVSLEVVERGESVAVHRARRGDATVIVALGPSVDRDADARFRDEARALDGALRGPGHVPSEAPFMERGRAIVRAEVVGRPLLGTPRPLLDALALLEPIARLLGRAHARGVGHGALSPERIALTDAGAVLLDLVASAMFGLPRTPAYSCPEQLEARACDPRRADVYGLALLFIAAVSGRSPWPDERELYAHALDRRRRPSLAALGVAVDPNIDRVLGRALAVDAELRYPDADAFWDALRAAVLAAPGTDVEPERPRVVEDAPATRARPPRAPLAIVAGASVGLIAIVFGAEAIVSAVRKPARKVAPSAVAVVASAPPAPSASPSPSVSAPPPAPPPPDMVSIGAFLIDRTEVTVKSYRACVVAGACTATYKHGTGYREDDPVRREWLCNLHRGQREDHPVNCVTFTQANAYCAFVGKRLPTGEEWTRAARGDAPRRYPWGDALPKCRDVVFARYGPENPGCHQQPIGTQPAEAHPLTASPFGALDMGGSLWEWTTERSARGLPILRGGAWDSPETGVTIDARLEQSPGNGDVTLGFRCAKGADQ